MSSVFVVTSGEYSNYRIEEVFSTKDLAEAFIAEIGQHDGPQIEEYELDKPLSSFWVTFVEMSEDGNTVSTYDGGPSIYTRRRTVDDEESVSFGDEAKYGTDPNRPGFNHCNIGTTGRRLLCVLLFTKDHERAIKVANERRAAIIAAGAWGDTEKANAILFGAKS